MSDFVMELAQWAQGGTGNSWLVRYSQDPNAATLFVNDLPNNPDIAAGFLRYQGGPTEETFTNPLLIRHPRMQVIVRHPNSEDSLDLIENIVKRLQIVKDQEVVSGGLKFSRVRMVGEPFELGPDPGKRQRAVCNFDVAFYDVP